MFRKSIAAMISVFLSLAIVIPAFAATPAEGTVVEGVSVPGIALGDTRAQVDLANGQPKSCKDRSYNDGRLGLDSICNYNVEGINNGGEILTLYFTAPDGSPAQASPDDVVITIQWETVVSGWVTTTGVNTTLAVNDPQAVIDAYPNAEVTYYDSGYIHEVRDPELGISIVRDWNVYGAFTSVRMTIFIPYVPTPPPPPPDMIRVDDIQMTGDRRSITAKVLVLDEQDQPVEGALVEATWYYSNGNTSPVSAETASDGFATFRVDKARRGNYYIYIHNVSLDGYVYDYINSITLGAYTKSK